MNLLDLCGPEAILVDQLYLLANTPLRHKYPMLSDGAIVLAEAFLLRIKLDEVSCDDDGEPAFSKALFGLSIACGFSSRYDRMHEAMSNYIDERLGYQPYSVLDQLAEEARREREAAKTGSPCVASIRRAEPGHVYILSNPAMPGLLKIGYTTKGVARRMKELARGAIGLEPFTLIASFPSATPLLHERAVHALLDAHRRHGTELFEVSREVAIKACSDIMGAPADVD